MATSSEKLKNKFLSKVRKDYSCWMWKGARDKDSYGIFCLDGRPKRATHVSLMIHTGEVVPKGMHVCHKCDHPWCVNPDHLWIDTAQGNVDDKMRKGRYQDQSGSNNFYSKLIEEDIRRIRDMLRCGAMHKDIAPQFGVNKSTISSINLGTTWSHVK